MMILGVFLLSVLTFVCSQPTQVPYVESVEAMEELTNQLEEQILSMENNVPDITDGRPHYAVLLTHIVRVADRLKMIGPIYDDVFIRELPTSMVIGLNHIDTVIKVTKEILYEIDNRTQKIQTLMETLCRDIEGHEVCNQLVHQAVVGDPVRYRQEADMLLSAGGIAQDLLDAGLVEIANKYEEIAFLIENMEELNPIVFKILEVLLSLDD